ncbi:MAG: type IV pilus assembly protein PilM [Phycisphaera sp.]|nr:type IV pilus assembly protein PilM [Phycisphaera sp.]
MAKGDSWGIEIGANAIKALHLVGDARHGVAVAGYEVVPFKTVLTSPDVNVEEEIRVNLDQLISRHDMSRSSVVLSVPGHMAFARFAKLPPVDPKKIPDIVRFEAIQQIPFPIEQVEWDYQVFSQEDSPDVEVGIFAITKDRLLQYLSNLKSVSLNPDALTLSPLAVYNAMAYDLDLGDTASGVILMDIGTSSTDVVIVENGRIWLRTLPIGGNNFTEALVRTFNLSFPKAEKLKREANTSKYARQIFQAMRPVFADLVQEMQRSLGFYQSLNRDAKLERVIGLGSTFRLPGLMKFLKQQLQLEVTRPDAFKRLTVEGRQEADFAQHAMNMATAYGCALQGLEIEKVSANLLPTYVIKRKLWRTKQPWVLGAAAVVALSAALSTVNYIMSKNAEAAARREYEQPIQAILNNADQKIQAIRQIKSDDQRQRIENLQRVLDYRDVWPKLVADLSQAFDALGPQEALYGSDYDAIKQVPRNDRRTIKIDSITAEYQFVWDEQATTDDAPAYDVDPSQIWGHGLSGSSPESSPDEGSPGGSPFRAFPGLNSGGFQPGELRALTDEQRRATDRTAQKPPSFFITIKGSTPNQRASTLLAHNYIKWLQDQPESETRPYRIIVDAQSIKKLELMPESALPNADTNAGPSRGPVGPVGRGQRPLNVGPWSSGTPAAGPDAEVTMPQNPLHEEPRNRDWRFEIQFVVQLLPPAEARDAFRGKSSTPGSPSEQPPPGSTPPGSTPPVSVSPGTRPADNTPPNPQAMMPAMEMPSGQEARS